MGAIPASPDVPKSMAIAAEAKKFASALQQRYPVDIQKFRDIQPKLEHSPGFCLANQTRDIQNHKLAVIALCKFVPASVARQANRENAVDEGDLEGFLRYFEARVSREDLPFYHGLRWYLFETRRDFARQSSFLFALTGRQRTFNFLFSFSKGLREACSAFMGEVHTDNPPEHHLGHAAIVLEAILEFDILHALFLAGKVSKQEAESISDAGKLVKRPPAPTYL